MDGTRDGISEALLRVKRSVYGVANGNSEDVVQEAVARAIKSGVSLEAEHWLRTVARRVAIDQHRRRRETPSGSPVDLERWIGSHDNDPEDAVLKAERAKYVREALAALPPRYQRALMVYAEEDSPSAVANRLGLSAAATWTLLSRARSRLKLQLEQAGFVPALLANRPRLSGLVAAGAVAAVATTAALVPSQPIKPKPSDVSQPKVVNVAPATRAPVMSERPAVKARLLPVAATDVTEPVDEAVDEVKAAPKKVHVGACLGRTDQIEVGVDLISVEDKQRSLRSALVDVLEEPLSLPSDATCAP